MCADAAVMCCAWNIFVWCCTCVPFSDNFWAFMVALSADLVLSVYLSKKPATCAAVRIVNRKPENVVFRLSRASGALWVTCVLSLRLMHHNVLHSNRTICNYSTGYPKSWNHFCTIFLWLCFVFYFQLLSATLYDVKILQLANWNNIFWFGIRCWLWYCCAFHCKSLRSRNSSYVVSLCVRITFVLGHIFRTATHFRIHESVLINAAFLNHRVSFSWPSLSSGE